VCMSVCVYQITSSINKRTPLRARNKNMCVCVCVCMSVCVPNHVIHQQTHTVACQQQKHNAAALFVNIKGLATPPPVNAFVHISNSMPFLTCKRIRAYIKQHAIPHSYLNPCMYQTACHSSFVLESVNVKWLGLARTIHLYVYTVYMRYF